MSYRTLLRKMVLAALGVVSSASAGICQERAPSTPGTLSSPASEMILDRPAPAGFRFADVELGTSGFLTGNRDFPNFIGFLSNPLQSIDPRAQTILFPMFGSAWASADSPRLPSSDMQVYGAGLWVAGSERLSFGFNQGGFAVVDVFPDRERLLTKLGLPVPERDKAGQREGWLNLGCFLQYTLIADVENQFIVTAGTPLEVPSGATQVFQGGDNPPYLAPYLTAGKEFGCWHVLATGGYEFPLGSGTATTNTFYLNLHLDRKIGWLYPLVEFNGSDHEHDVDLSLPLRHRVLDLGGFSSTGNLLTVAVGANAVLIPGKLTIHAASAATPREGTGSRGRSRPRRASQRGRRSRKRD
jgi:hypothetical protein